MRHSQIVNVAKYFCLGSASPSLIDPIFFHISCIKICTFLQFYIFKLYVCMYVCMYVLDIRLKCDFYVLFCHMLLFDNNDNNDNNNTDNDSGS